MAGKSELLITNLKKIVLYSIMLLACLMTLVVIWSVIDVIIILYKQLRAEPFLQIGGEHMLEVFSSFLTVLIAIEIFVNIVIYLSKNVFQVQLVVATALTAVARKVIVLDYSTITPMLGYAIASILLASTLAYWLTSQKEIALLDEAAQK